MKPRTGIVCAAMLCASWVAAAQAPSAEFPAAPADLTAATAAGLRRLAQADLKRLFVGARVERNSRGEIHTASYGEDGKVEQRAGTSVVDTGTFSVVGMAGGSVCLLLVRQMNQRLCAVWFEAADGRHLFGYNPTDGRLRAVSRAADPP